MAPIDTEDWIAVTAGHFGTHMWDLKESDLMSNGFILVRRIQLSA